MMRTITLLSENGAPMDAGLSAELLRDGNVVAQATIDAAGVATFEVETKGPLRVRVVVPERMLVTEHGVPSA